MGESGTTETWCVGCGAPEGPDSVDQASDSIFNSPPAGPAEFVVPGRLVCCSAHISSSIGDLIDSAR